MPVAQRVGGLAGAPQRRDPRAPHARSQGPQRLGLREADLVEVEIRRAEETPLGVPRGLAVPDSRHHDRPERYRLPVREPALWSGGCEARALRQSGNTVRNTAAPMNSKS